MGSFVDFGLLKEKVSFGQAIELLDLKLRSTGHQARGPCPTCQTGGDRALVVTEGRGWYCFALKKGGDVIALAAHTLDLGTREAAQELAERAGIVPVPSTRTSGKILVPESEGAKDNKPSHGMQPLSYLEPEHDAVIAVGFDPEWCKLHGVGYAPKGIARGNILIPFRDDTGALLGYLGVEDLTFIPKDFQTNVIPLRRKA